MQRMAEEGNVDIITGDWLSEMNIAWNAITKAQDPSLGYEAGFLDQLEDSIDTIVTKKIKVITNAGALNTIALRDAVEQICRARGHSAVVVAAVLGDDVTGQVIDRDKQKLFRHLDDKALSLDAWGINDLESSSAAAYIGAWGIVEALKQGADIVICGRVTDASPVVSHPFQYLYSTMSAPISQDWIEGSDLRLFEKETITSKPDWCGCLVVWMAQGSLQPTCRSPHRWT